MRVRFGAIIPTALTISFGFLVLLGLLVGDNLGALSVVVRQYGIRELALICLQITAITIALTIILGILNLLSVHVRRVVTRGGGFIYSLVLLLSFGTVIALRVTGNREWETFLLENVQIPIESALAGLLLFALVYGAATVTRRRVTWSSLLFVLVIVIVLIGSVPLAVFQPVAEVNAWLLSVPVNAGARGILLGIALATVVAAMRVLIGQDRSYRE